MDDREKLYPTIGKLHPEGLGRLAKCEDYDQVKAVADIYPVSDTHTHTHTHTHHCSVHTIACGPLHVFPSLLHQEYAAIFAGAGTNPGEKTLEDKFFEKEARTARTSFHAFLLPPV